MVSVIIPCYNSAPYIAHTIASIQAQTTPDWEAIVIDDGSTDASASIVETLAAQDSRIRLVRKENGGSASARNAGLGEVKGDYIQFLDADDTIDPDKFRRQIALIEKEDLDLCYTDYVVQEADGSIRKGVRGLDESLWHMLIGWGPLGTIPPHCYLYRTSFVETHQLRFPVDIREREDWEWHLRVFAHHPRAKRLKGYAGAIYFRCPTGKTTNGSEYKLLAGNCRFLCYRIRHSCPLYRAGLLLRLSTEIWNILYLLVRYRMSDLLQLRTIFSQSSIHFLYFIIATLMMPLSFFVYLIGGIRRKVQRKKINDRIKIVY